MICRSKPNVMAISAERSEEEDKVFQGLNKLREEDRSFVVEKDTETGEIVCEFVRA